MNERRLWHEAVALGGDVTRLGHGSARRETGALTHPPLTIAADVDANGAAGYTHHSAREQLAHYVAAGESPAELERPLAVGRAGRVQRLLAHHAADLERQLDPNASSPPRDRTPSFPGQSTRPGARLRRRVESTAGTAPGRRRP